MQLVVYFNNSKAKQVINLSDKFAVGHMGHALTDSDIRQKARDLAIYIGGGDYFNHNFTS